MATIELPELLQTKIYSPGLKIQSMCYCQWLGHSKDAVTPSHSEPKHRGGLFVSPQAIISGVGGESIDAILRRLLQDCQQL